MGSDDDPLTTHEDRKPRLTPTTAMPDGVRYDLPIVVRTPDGRLHATLRVRVFNDVDDPTLSIVWRLAPKRGRR